MTSKKECTKDHPMPQEDKDKYNWVHIEANIVDDLDTLGLLCYCPVCGTEFIDKC